MEKPSEIQEHILKKKNLLLGAQNARPALGIPAELAQITSPSDEDARIAGMV